MSILGPGVSALDASQTALNVIGENLANANTPGYHRQVVDLTEAVPTQLGKISVGSGVNVADTRRQIDNPLETAITNQTYSLADTTAQLNTLQQVQTSLSPSSGSLHDDIEQFFNQITQLAAQPSDTTQRRRHRQPLLANGTQTLTQAFDGLVGDVATQVQQLTTQQTSQQAIGQQLQVQQQSVSGVDPNEEMVNLLNFQRSFQIASEYIGTVSTTLNSLLQILQPSIA